MEQQILARLEKLEAVNSIRNALNRYMEICDSLNADTDLDGLMDLFAEDAVWEGIGKRYSTAFGCLQGKPAVRAMFQSYIKQDAHFSMNAHFVNSEQIQVEGAIASGKWLMLQTSSFSRGGSQLTAAKLTIDFKKQREGEWMIFHFRTENIFSRRIDAWSDELDLPVPDEAST